MGRVDCSFMINGRTWIIKYESAVNLLERAKKMDEEATYAYGFCDYPIQTIFLNKDCSVETQKKTLLHELEHCWLWNNGFSSVSDFSEEMVCDILSDSYAFVLSVLILWEDSNEGLMD